MRPQTALRIAAFVLATLAQPIVAAAADWPVIAPADLALKAPRIDPNADAEALLWEVRVTDSDALDELATILEHHVRIKVFTDRGREAQSKVDISYSNGTRVREVEGRTIAPDGTITELRGRDVFDRTIIEASGIKVKAKSFVLPAVVPGAIIEYKWREVRDNEVADDLELTLPAGMSVDEMPAAVTREAPFGRFSVQWQALDNLVLRTLSLRVERSTVSPESYAEALTFFAAFREAEQLPVVLARR